MFAGCTLLLSLALPLMVEPAATRSRCTPTLVLDGVDEETWNEANVPFTLKPRCGTLDTSSHGVFVRSSNSSNAGASPSTEFGALVSGTTITPERITISGLDHGDHIMTAVAAGEEGEALMGSFMLRFGSSDAPGTAAKEKRGLVRRVDASSARTTCSGPGNRGAAAPMCRMGCRSPVYGSCDFYKTCAEATLHCGASGYPLRYGDKNCRRFVSNMGLFSGRGRRWINDTMMCLQRALIGPLADGGATCDGINTAAFDSHAKCYVDSGVCDLPLTDIMSVVITVKTDLVAGPAMRQILGTAAGCLTHHVDEMERNVSDLRRAMTKDMLHAPSYLGQIALLEGVKKQLMD